MSRVEQPEYKVTASQGSIEIRAYGPMIAAEAEVQGERKAAIQEVSVSSRPTSSALTSRTPRLQ